MPGHLLCLHYFEIISLPHLFQKTWRNVSTGAMKPLMPPQISILYEHEIFAALSGLRYRETDRASILRCICYNYFVTSDIPVSRDARRIIASRRLKRSIFLRGFCLPIFREIDGIL